MIQDQKNHIFKIKKQLGQVEFIFLMAALMASNALAIDIMLPAFPHIINYFQLHDHNSIQLIISMYLLGFGIFQIIFGPISDRFGRRIPILIGMTLYTICAFFCLLSSNFEFLLILRFLQGASAAATRVLVMSITRDLYSGREMAKIMSFTNIVFMIIPIIAPFTGQSILFFFSDWQVIFILIGMSGILITLWAYFRLPETLYKAQPLTFSGVKHGFMAVFSNRTAICYNLALSCIFGALYGSLNSAQQIYVEIYNLGNLFSLAFATIAIFLTLASLNNTRMLKKYSIRKISHTQLLCFITGSAIWLVFALSFEKIPFMLYMILYGMTMVSFGGLGANFNTIAMNNLGQIAGTAASVFGFSQTVIGVIIGTIIGQSFNETTIPLATGFFTVGIIALCLILYAEKGSLFKTKNENDIIKA